MCGAPHRKAACFRGGVVCMEGLMVTVKLVVVETAVVNTVWPAYKADVFLREMAQWCRTSWNSPDPGVWLDSLLFSYQAADVPELPAAVEGGSVDATLRRCGVDNFIQMDFG